MSYLDLLNENWKLVLAPRSANAPTVISLFAGGGGSSLGYVMAGFKELLAVEMNQNAINTLKLNFPNLRVYGADVSKLSVDELFSITGLNYGELDVLDGSPPCQGFSTAGKRDILDGRNQLFKEFVRILKGANPKVFVMENVSGLVKGKMKRVFHEIMRSLKSCGYNVSCRLLNSKYFHVPQSRQRLIFVGIRNDLGIKPSHPSPQSQVITIKQAIGDLGNEQKRNICHYWKDESKTSKTYHLAKKAKQGEKYAGYQRRDYWNQPSRTLTKLGVVGYPNLRGMNCHPIYTRTYSLREYARLSSFPDQYQWVGEWEGYNRIGNAVPPLMMKYIALHINDLLYP